MKKITVILLILFMSSISISAQIMLQGYNKEAYFMYQKASNALRSRRLTPAKIQFKKLIEKFPDTNFASLARMQLAKIYRDMGDNDSAISALKDIIKTDKNKTNIAEAKKLISEIYFKLQQFRDGIELLEEWRKKEPRTVWISRELAKFYLQTGKKDEAWLLLNRMLEQTSSPAIFQDMLDLAVRTGEVENLLSTIENRKVIYTNQSYADFVSDCYIAMNKTDKAIEVLKTTPKVDENILLLRKLANLEIKQNKPEEALIPLSKIRKIVPYDWETLKQIGNCLFLLKRVPEAISTWRIPMGVPYMRRQDYFQNYTNVLIEHGLYREALEGFREAREALGSRTMFAEEMASVLEAMGKKKEAIEEYLSVFENGEYKIDIFNKLYKNQSKSFSLKKRLIEANERVYQFSIKQALLELYFREQNKSDINAIIELVSSASGSLDDLIFSRLKQESIIVANSFHFDLCKAFLSKYSGTTLSLKLANLLLQIAETDEQKKEAFSISGKIIESNNIADAELTAQLLLKLSNYSLFEMCKPVKAMEYVNNILETNLNIACPNEAEKANLAKAHILVIEGKFAEAETVLEKCEKQIMVTPINELNNDIVFESDMKAKIKLEKAFLMLNKQEYQKALFEIRGITEELPESFWTNDALKMALFITRGSVGNFDVLNKLVSSKRLFLSGKFKQAIKSLEKVAETQTASSTGLIYDVKAEILKMKEKTDSPRDLIKEINKFLATKPSTWVIPDLLILKLRLLMDTQKDNVESKNVIDEFIDKFPDDIRCVKLKRLRKLFSVEKVGNMK